MKKSIVRVLALVLMLTLVITSSAAALKLQKNDKSDNVRRLQQALTQLGYYSGTVDGSFGSGTKAAVTAFQQANSHISCQMICFMKFLICLKAVTTNCSLMKITFVIFIL